MTSSTICSGRIKRRTLSVASEAYVGLYILFIFAKPIPLALKLVTPVAPASCAASSAVSYSYIGTMATTVENRIDKCCKFYYYFHQR